MDFILYESQGVLDIMGGLAGFILLVHNIHYKTALVERFGCLFLAKWAISVSPVGVKTSKIYGNVNCQSYFRYLLRKLFLTA